MTIPETPNSPALLILSLGGNVDPLIRSITAMRPTRLCFIATAQSAEGIDCILHSVGSDLPNETIVLSNGQDIAQITRELTFAIAGHHEWTQLAHEGRLMVDLTVGTKAMAASIALAFSSLPVIFSYVGGMARTKNGLGSVCRGMETIFTCLNPLFLRI